MITPDLFYAVNTDRSRLKPKKLKIISSVTPAFPVWVQEEDTTNQLRVLAIHMVYMEFGNGMNTNYHIADYITPSGTIEEMVIDWTNSEIKTDIPVGRLIHENEKAVVEN